jgi:hypothetical protein
MFRKLLQLFQENVFRVGYIALAVAYDFHRQSLQIQIRAVYKRGKKHVKV